MTDLPPHVGATPASSPYGIVYGLFDPRSDELRYIGQTTKSLDHRFRKHMATSSKLKSHLGNWLRALARQGLIPVIRKLAEAETHDELISREIAEIFSARMRGSKLVNTTDGGDGVAGFTHRTESKELMAAAKRGTRLSAETRAKMSKVRAGKPVSEATKTKIRNALMDHPVSELTRSKIATANRNRSPENLELLSNSAKRRYAREAEQGLTGWRVTSRRGVEHRDAKFTEQDIRLIRREHAAGESMLSLSKRYAVAHSTINKIVKRITWLHVLPEVES